MPLVMTWTGASDVAMSSNSSNTTVLFQSTTYVTATTSDIPPYSCTVTFLPPTGNTGPSNQAIQATNAPSYSSKAQSTPYAVQRE